MGIKLDPLGDTKIGSDQICPWLRLSKASYAHVKHNLVATRTLKSHTCRRRGAPEQGGPNAMLFDLIDLLMRPEAYVCVWRDGELYVEPAAPDVAATAGSTEQTTEAADEQIAA